MGSIIFSAPAAPDLWFLYARNLVQMLFCNELSMSQHHDTSFTNADVSNLTFLNDFSMSKAPRRMWIGMVLEYNKGN